MVRRALPTVTMHSNPVPSARGSNGDSSGGEAQVGRHGLGGERRIPAGRPRPEHGSRRDRPRKRAIEVVARDELWLAVPGEWWVLCGYTDAARSLYSYKVHATAPFEAPGSDDEILWVDLDLDFEITTDEVDLQDEDQFHDHALSMGYPDRVVRGAWSGISTIAARYTNGAWPFDGSMQEWMDGA
jgi:hypothetical protein